MFGTKLIVLGLMFGTKLMVLGLMFGFLWYPYCSMYLECKLLWWYLPLSSAS